MSRHVVSLQPADLDEMFNGPEFRITGQDGCFQFLRGRDAERIRIGDGEFALWADGGVADLVA
jgi:hypothetical protein